MTCKFCDGCPRQYNCNIPRAVCIITSLLIVAVIIAGLVGLGMMGYDKLKPAEAKAAAPAKEEPRSILTGLETSEHDTSSQTSASLVQRPADGPIDLKAPIVWRQVTLFDPDTGEVVESWLTGDKVDYVREDTEHKFVKNGRISSVIVDNTAIEIIPTEVAERIKDDPTAIRRYAERNRFDSGNTDP